MVNKLFRPRTDSFEKPFTKIQNYYFGVENTTDSGCTSSSGDKRRGFRRPKAFCSFSSTKTTDDGAETQFMNISDKTYENLRHTGSLNAPMDRRRTPALPSLDTLHACPQQEAHKNARKTLAEEDVVPPPSTSSSRENVFGELPIPAISFVNDEPELYG